MNQIEFKINKSKTEGLQNWTNDFFPSHFLAIICGKPGKGKTTLIKQLLQDDRLFFKQFNFVFCISPSIEEFYDLFLPSDNISNKFSIEWIFNHIEKINNLK